MSNVTGEILIPSLKAFWIEKRQKYCSHIKWLLSLISQRSYSSGRKLWSAQQIYHVCLFTYFCKSLAGPGSNALICWSDIEGIVHTLQSNYKSWFEWLSPCDGEGETSLILGLSQLRTTIIFLESLRPFIGWKHCNVCFILFDYLSLESTWLKPWYCWNTEPNVANLLIWCKKDTSALFYF